MRNLEVIVTPTAEKDIQNIFDFIAHDNINKALELINKFEKKFETLSMFPNSDVKKPHFMVRDVRMSIVAGHYRIFYSVKNDIIYIQRVLTGFQDIYYC